MNRIDLRVARGVVYGLLGPNGSSAQVLGHDVAKDAAQLRAKRLLQAFGLAEAAG